MEQGKIDRIGPMRIGGMDCGLDVRCVQQHVQHVVTLMFVGPNDFGIDWDMIGHQAMSNDRLEPKYFGE